MNAARPRLALTLGGLALTGLIVTPAATYAGEVASHNEQVVLYHESGKQGDAESELNGTAQVLSHDGRVVVFSTAAPLVAKDTNGVDDVYLRSVDEGSTRLVSVRNGRPGNDDSFEPTVSADGRFIAFTTWATNLAKDTAQDNIDVLVKDMQTGAIRRVSVDSQERQRQRNSFYPVISGNGRSVSFQTFAALGSKDDDRLEDVYVRDLKRGTTKQVSLLPGGSRDVRESVLNGDISDDGNLVTFGNDNMLWVRNVSDGTTIRFHQEPDSAPCQPFEGLGSAGRPAISGDGQYVAFSSCAVDLPGEDHLSTDIYRKSLATGEITRVTAGDDHSYHVSLSRDGQVVGFASDASNLVAGDGGNPDAFVADLATQTITRASQTADGTGGNSWSATQSASISGDGDSLAYVTYADNLVEGDMYNWPEALVWRR